MKLKKNPKKDINKRSGVYFAIGLVTVMLLSYIALEWKTYDISYNPDIGMNQLDEPLDEKAPVFILETPPPPPSPVIPIEIEIVKDEDPIKESIIAIIEPDQNTEIPENHTFNIIEDEPEPDVTWINIEEAPIYPGCENETDKRDCFAKMVQKHIGQVFRYPEQERELGIQGRVNVMFDIQKDGTIGNIRMRGPNDNLENEAGRIIGKLPKMTPGKQRDRNVKVSFAIPITFKLQ
ncbi:energy transducer TonB [Maribacter chungangensis]|uniref:Energy transducer TonB n=1 Tax=Maribacter chungangensis TaxID=1069117 RepID=A0ABW3B891_9FLAO